MGLVGVCFEISTTCSKCEKPLPLNGISESVLCDGCRTAMPTPKELWESILGDAVEDGIAAEVGSGQNSTIMGGHGTFKLTYGRQDPRCNPTCKTPYDPEAIARGVQTGVVACGTCGKRASVRRAPDWMRSLHPKLAVLVGETTGAQTVSTKPEPGEIKFHCYHCGGALPLDGVARSVKCSFCNNQLMVPDEIWVRMNPVRTIERWYAVFELDLSHAAGALPADTSEFADFGVEPAGNLIVAWHDYDRGDVGHGCRIALANGDGVLLWKQTGVEFSEDARLFVSPASGTVWLVDPEKGFAREIDPRTGDPIRTLASPADDGSDVLSVRDHHGFAIDWDGTFLVMRQWSTADSECLRRFGPDGRRMPLWPGQKILTGEDASADWPELKHKPAGFPSSALFCVGWDGCIYVADDDGAHLAKYGRDGQLFGVMPLPSDILSNVRAVQATRDGTVLILFEHKEKIGDDDWMHVARVRPNGQVEIAFGAHVGDAVLVGQYDRRLKAMPDGTFFVGNELDSIRGYGPDGRLVFATPATRRKTKELLEELAKSRRGKKLAQDRG